MNTNAVCKEHESNLLVESSKCLICQLRKENDNLLARQKTLALVFSGIGYEDVARFDPTVTREDFARFRQLLSEIDAG